MIKYGEVIHSARLGYGVEYLDVVYNKIKIKIKYLTIWKK